eukprot:11070951-Ditylum_brightwellii.AAC.1
MNTPGTFSAPFLRKDLLPSIKILKVQPAFKVKPQEEANKYELYNRTAANGSTQVQAAAEAMLLFPLDASNASQTNIESNPSKRVHISITPFYLEYFFTKWPDHPLKGTPAEKICIQAFRSMQGSKDA